MSEALIVAAARSPIGRAFKGRLASERADDLAATMVQAAMSQVPDLPWDAVSDLMLGAAHQSGEQAQNLGRRVSVLLGRDDLPGTTVSRACASSLQTTMMAAAAIRAGYGSAYVSAGVEVVSRYSKMAGPEDRNKLIDGSAQLLNDDSLLDGGWSDPRDSGGRPNFYTDMGITAENVATLRGISRHRQDDFALASQRKYRTALEAGFWATDITPVRLADGSILAADESPRPGTLREALATLDPVFKDGGTVTAGNSCPLNDGAAALVVASAETVAEYGLTPKARIISFGLSGLSPETMGLGPIEACVKALKAAGMTISDVDVMEINEAFAAQAIPCIDELGIDPERVNPHGGAIALGHPFGMTGARMATTLLNGLTWRDETVGLETMCVGGGMGMAMIVERLN